MFVFDGESQDNGSLSGWSLAITTVEPECCTEPQFADLGLEAEMIPREASPGGAVSYLLTLTNHGPAAATAIRVTNWLPSKVTFQSAVPSQGSCLESNGVVVCLLGDVASGTSAQVVIGCLALEGGTLTNAATATSEVSDPNVFNNSLTACSSPWPRLTVSSGTIWERDYGESKLVFTIMLTPPSAEAVTVQFSTEDDTAVAESDYTATNGTLVFLPKQTTKLVPVIVFGDATAEPDERFFLRLFNATNAIIATETGVGAILNNDPQPNIYCPDVAITEGHSNYTALVVQVNLDAHFEQTIAVGYGTADGTARAGSDYVSTNGTLVFTNGWTSQNIMVQVIGDIENEPTESFFLWLTNSAQPAPGVEWVVCSILDHDGPRIVAEGLELGAEGFTPANGALDAGERVTVHFTLRNISSLQATNLLATLLPGYGVVAPSGPQNYECLAPGGASVRRAFSFSVAPEAVGGIVARLRLQEGPTECGTLEFHLPVGPPAEFAVLELATNQAAAMVPSAFTKSPWGGIAVSSNQLFVNGGFTARFAAEDLSSGAILSRSYDTLMANLRTETVYCLASDNASLLEIDGNTGELTGHSISLSRSIPLKAIPGFFAGYDRLVIDNGERIFNIALPWGMVSDLGPSPELGHARTQSECYWGVAEYFDGAVHLVYVKDRTTIVRTRVPDGKTATIASFTDLGNMGAIAFSPSRSRWYFQTEGLSQFYPVYSDQLVGFGDAQCMVGADHPPIILSPPVSCAVAVGETAILEVEATGQQPLHFQWQKDGVNLVTGTNASLAISNAQANDIGSYSVLISNALGVALSSNVMVQVAPIEFVVAVVDGLGADTNGPGLQGRASMASLQSLGFAVAATTNIEAAVTTHRCLLIPTQEGGRLPDLVSRGTLEAISNFVAQGGTLIVHGACWNAQASGLLNETFGFQLEEWFQDALKGISPTRPTAKESGSEPALDAYEYYLGRSAEVLGTEFEDDPIAIPEYNYTSLLWKPSFPANAHSLYEHREYSAVSMFEYGRGLIFFLGWNWGGAAPLGAKDGGWLQVLASAIQQRPLLLPRLAEIRMQPLPQVTAAGAGARLSIRVCSAEPFLCQWWKDGIAIPGATNTSYSVVNAQLNDAGLYSVSLSNASGLTLSSNALLRVVEAGFSLRDNFDSGFDPAQWSVFSGAVLPTNFGGSVSAPNSLWFGGDGERYAITRSLETRAGAVLSFHLRMGNKSAYPWEKPDSGREVVALEYSTNGGLHWTEFAQYQAPMDQWTSISAVAPLEALSASTLFRWRQLEPSGDCCDHWALDNIVIMAEPGPPQIFAQPASQTVIWGSSATLEVIAVGPGPLNYQWSKEETNIIGATNSYLTIVNTQSTDAGQYAVSITNEFGQTWSDPARLRVVPAERAVAVFDDPAYVHTSGNVHCESDNVQASLRSLEFVVSTFTNIESTAANSQRLLFPSLESDLGADLLPATRAALSNFVVQGGSLIVHAGSVGDYATHFLNVVFGSSLETINDSSCAGFIRTERAVGTPFEDDPETLPYWYSTSSLAPDRLPSGSRVIYQTSNGIPVVVVIECGNGLVTLLGWNWYDAAPNGPQDGGWLAVLESAAAQAVPLPCRAPSILMQPAAQTLPAGMIAKFRPEVTGTWPLFHQWQKDGMNLASATNAMFVISRAQAADSGDYRFIVTNACGAATSEVVTLTVLDAPASEEFEIVTLSTSGSYTRTHLPLTGGARSALAASSSHLFYTGQDSTARFSLDDLSGDGALGQIFDLLVSDLRSGKLYSLGDDFGPITPFGGVITSLYEHDGVTGELTGAVLPLATPIELLGDIREVGLFAGFGRVVLHNGTRVFDIILPAGLVFDLGPMPALRHASTPGAGYWGVAEYCDGSLRLVYMDGSRQAMRTTVPSGETASLGYFSSLPDLATFTVSVLHGRWYFKFRSIINEELLGYGDATFRIGSSGAPVILRHPVSQQVAVGGSAGFDVRVWSTSAWNCQWFKNQLALPGATNAAYAITGACRDDVGLYQVLVFNPCGSAISSEAVLLLLNPGTNFFDDLEPGLDPAQWSAFSGSVLATNWGGSVSGGNALWFGGAEERFAVTRPLEVGGVLEFSLRLADGDCFPWEQPDLPEEAVVVECSTDGGISWDRLAICEGPEWFRWRRQSLVIPTESQSMLIRWRQLTHSGECCDHWALDDISLIPAGMPTNLPPLQLLLSRPAASQFDLFLMNSDGTGIAADRLPFIHLFATTNLSVPFSQWEPVTAPMALFEGLLRIPALEMTNASKRFYQAVEIP